jgi:hypothetical protein
MPPGLGLSLEPDAGARMDVLIPQGKAVREDLALGKLLVDRGSSPETAVSVCAALDSKAVSLTALTAESGVYGNFGGNVRVEEVWEAAADPDTVLWSFPQSVKAMLHKRVRLSAGKVSVMISVPHLVKLALLFFSTQDLAAQALRSRAPGCASLPVVGQGTMSFGDGEQRAAKVAVEDYKHLAPSVAMALQALPAASSFRALLGDVVRRGHVKAEEVLPAFTTLRPLMRAHALAELTDAPAKPDVKAHRLTGTTAQAALAANARAEPPQPLPLALPRHFAQAVMSLLLRYQSLQGASARGGGHQASITPTVFRVLQREFGVMGECFASPLNARFSRFCSAFPDVDAPFGSLGSFFRFTPASGSYQANPPFHPEVILATALHIEQLLGQRRDSEHPLGFVVIIPHKPDQLGWQHLEQSPFCTGRITIQPRHHAYFEGLQQNKKLVNLFHVARHATSVFILQNPAAHQKWTPKESRLRKVQYAFEKFFVSQEE